LPYIGFELPYIKAGYNKKLLVHGLDRVISSNSEKSLAKSGGDVYKSLSSASDWQ
jgi:hypothetical protein